MKWLDKRWLDLGHGEHVNSLWHCFGVKDEIVDHDTAVAMLRASQTALLPINCHRLLEPAPIHAEGRAYGEPLIGHGTITWDTFKPIAQTLNLVPCLNINLQTSSDAAVALAHEGRDRTGIDLLKLEVLTSDLADSDDQALLEATEQLIGDDFRVMPLISADVEIARELVALDVPLLRVMGSPIGSGLGILNPDAIAAIVELLKPVILDGGIGYAGHAHEALRLGCAGLLVNSMLFANGNDPVSTLRHIRGTLASWQITGETLTPLENEGWAEFALRRGIPKEWVEWYQARTA